MCLGIPMRVLEVDGLWARCEGRGVQRRVNLGLLGEASAGSWLLVLGDSARERLEPDEASRIDLALDAVEAALRGETDLSRYFPDLDGLSARGAPAAGSA